MPKAKTDVAVQDTNTELAEIEAQMAAEAEAMSAGLKASTDKITTTNKEYKLPDGTVLGPTMEAVILGFTKSHSYYENEDFDANNIQEPICLSDATNDEIEQPPASIEKPMSSDCGSCPNNEYGSASRGKGKRCKEERRITLIPVGTDKPVVLNMPPTAIKAFDNTIKSIIAANGLPVKAICKFEFNPAVQFSQPIITDARDNPEAAKHYALRAEAVKALYR